MASSNVGGSMQKILRGVLQYRKTTKSKLLDQLNHVGEKPQPNAVFFTCMDSRLHTSQIMNMQIGDMFVFRNAGNIIPRATAFGDYGGEVTAAPEPAAVELACVRGGIRHVIVCGHSDCKAMQTLHSLPKHVDPSSSLETWLRKHGYASLAKLDQHLKNASAPIQYISAVPNCQFTALIDPDNTLSPTDKLSQINCLQSLENIASHSSIQEHLATNQIQLHAMWFDMHTGEVHYFSRQSKRFLLLDEETVDKILNELGEK